MRWLTRDSWLQTMAAAMEAAPSATEQQQHHEHNKPVDTPYQHSLLKSKADYDRMYKHSVEDPAGFWADIASTYHWEQKVCLLTLGMHSGTLAEMYVKAYASMMYSPWHSPRNTHAMLVMRQHLISS